MYLLSSLCIGSAILALRRHIIRREGLRWATVAAVLGGAGILLYLAGG